MRAKYIPINKVATQSLLELFEKYQDTKKPDFVFAFVRNPFDRLVSTYENQVRNPSNFSKQFFRKGMHKSFWKFGLRPEMTFKEFVQRIHKIPDKNCNWHFKSQYTFIPENIDFLGYFENLEKDFNEVCRILGEKKELPHKNKSLKRKNYRDYYDEETKKLVEERYKTDLKRFGYKF